MASNDVMRATPTTHDNMEDNIAALGLFPPDSDPDVTLDSEGSDTATTQTTDGGHGIGWNCSSSDTAESSTSAMSTNTKDGTMLYDDAWFERMSTWKPPYSNHEDEDEDGYDSDDSCASHDSFVSNVLRRTPFPPRPKPYYPPEHYDFFSKSVGEKPSAPMSMRAGEKEASSSMLESLPAELKVLILLNMPDLETLRSMVRASPTMHANYLCNRHRILSTCLDRELDGFYVDAYATLKSRPVELGWMRKNVTITDFLNSYNGWLASSDSYPCAKLLPPSRVRWMAAFHMSVARPLVRRYIAWVLGNLQTAVLLEATVDIPLDNNDDTALTRSEERRIFRAVYRHETYSHLFGQNMGSRSGSFRKSAIHDIFFRLFHPWDAEAIGCFNQFLCGQWGEIFLKVRDEIRPDEMNWRHCGGIYDEESYDLYKDTSIYQDGMVSRGLKVLTRVLAIDDEQNLVSAMERCLMSPADEDASISQIMTIDHPMFGLESFE